MATNDSRAINAGYETDESQLIALHKGMTRDGDLATAPKAAQQGALREDSPVRR